MSAEEFEKLVNEVWALWLPLIPVELRAHFDKIRILIADEPPAEVLKELEGTELAEHPEELCGLYLGTPLPDTGLFDRHPFPDRIYLFRKALLDFAEYDNSKAGLRRLKEEITITLLHEIGHFFGLDEDDLERLGFD